VVGGMMSRHDAWCLSDSLFVKGAELPAQPRVAGV